MIKISYQNISLTLIILGLFSSCNVHNSDIDNNPNGHEYVDLGLSVKWATMNIGAHTPADFGNYYSWGCTTHNTQDYNWAYEDLLSHQIIDNNGNLTMSYDVASVTWGGSWRLPTNQEQQELLTKCNWIWTDSFNDTGVEEYIITGTNGNSIFLPAADGRNSVLLSGHYGIYWSATAYNDSLRAYALWFDKDNHSWSYDYGRMSGFSVRAVLK